MTAETPLLDVRDLAKHYPVTDGVWNREVGRVRAVDGIDLTVGRGEAVGLVGESGCGKSTAARAMLRIEEPTGGTVRFDGEDVTGYDRERLKRFRRRAQLILQDPSSSFDPRRSIGQSIAEPLSVHGMSDRHRRRRLVEGTLERVGLSSDAADRYPHELSGGEKQRAALARALIVDPDLLVADEPVSALDMSVQTDVLDLLDRLCSELGLGVLLISHDLSVVREVCDRVAVMYLGEIVESGPVRAVFGEPKHPYTRALLASMPVPDPTVSRREVDLVGDVPDAADPPSGCRFHTRCPAVIPPKSYDLDADVWRRIHRLRTRLSRDASAVDVDAVRAKAAADAERNDDLARVERSGGTDPASDAEDFPTESSLVALKRGFGLPNRLSDPDADAALNRALSRLASGEREAAAELLSAEFGTVCERDAPTNQWMSPEHEAACHLLDGERDSE